MAFFSIAALVTVAISTPRFEAFGAGPGRQLQPSLEVVGSPQGPTAGEPWRGHDLCGFAVEPGRFLSVPGTQLRPQDDPSGGIYYRCMS